MFIRRIVCIVMLAQGHSFFAMDDLGTLTTPPGPLFPELQIQQPFHNDFPNAPCAALPLPATTPEAISDQSTADQPIALPVEKIKTSHNSNEKKSKLAKALIDGYYVCNLIHPGCKYTVSSTPHFSYHLEKHDNDAYSHICHTCNQRCETEGKLKTHCYSQHGRAKSLYTCVHPDCRFEHRKIAIMQEHIEFRHNSISYPYICTYCDHRFEKQHGLTIHIHSVHIGKDIVIQRINADGTRTTILQRPSCVKSAAAAAKAANLTHSRE